MIYFILYIKKRKMNINNFCSTLSCGGDPLLAGYSQSKSRPSNPCCLKNEIEFRTNSPRLFLLATIELKVATPWFHPPTANVTLRSGFSCFKLIISAYIWTSFHSNVASSFLPLNPFINLQFYLTLSTNPHDILLPEE